MKKSIMKKVIFLLMMSIICLNGVSFAQLPPAKIVFHNIVDGECPFNPLKKSVMPKKYINIYASPDVNSNILEAVAPNEYCQIKALELHTYPYENQVNANNQTFYYLYYAGEGHYVIWINDEIKNIYMGTNQIDTKSDLWICIQSSKSKLEGWTKFESKNDWYTEVGAGIFL